MCDNNDNKISDYYQQFIFTNMKKLIFSSIALLAACFTSVTMTSCDNEDTPTTVKKVELSTPKFNDYAAKYELKDGPYASIELTESGNFIIERSNDVNAPMTRAGEDEKTIVSGSYVVLSSNKYDLKGFGELTIDGAEQNLTLTLNNKETGNTEVYSAVKSAVIPMSLDAELLCRTWSISKQVKVNGVSMTFNMIEKRYGMFEYGVPEQLVVTKTGTFFLSFNNGEKKGTWEWNATDDAIYTSLLDKLTVDYGETVKVTVNCKDKDLTNGEDADIELVLTLYEM